MVETRDLIRAELQQFRRDFAQRELTDGDYLAKLWHQGGTAVRLSAREMQRLISIIEHPSVQESLQALAEAFPDDVKSLFEWVSLARKIAFPVLDLGGFEAKCRWNTIEEGIRLCRKIGVLCKIYQDNRDMTPVRIPLSPASRRLILWGS